MMTEVERMTMALRVMPRDQAQRVVKSWAMTEILARKSIEQAMIADGWEVVDAPSQAPTVGEGEDARPVMWVRDVPYALPPDTFRQRRDEALAEAVARERERRATVGAVEPVPGEALTSVLCPKCKAVMAKSPICPKCADGIRGFKILTACTECGHEVKL
jgi:hypothetical protein